MLSKNHVIFLGGRGSLKDHIGSQGAKKGLHNFSTLPKGKNPLVIRYIWFNQQHSGHINHRYP